MFKAEISRINEFKSIIDGVSRIVDEIVLETDSEGIRAKALDRSHISFIGFDLKSTFFDTYDISEPEKINVDMDQIYNILKRAKKDDTLELRTDAENNIIFTFIGESRRQFKIHQIDMEYTSPEPPEIDTVVNKLSIPFHILKETMDDINMVGDKVNLKVTDTELIFSSFGNFSDVESKYIHGEKIDLTGTVESNYSIEFINYLLKVNKVSNNIEMSLSSDTPLLLYLINDDVNVNFLLAPRLERE